MSSGSERPDLSTEVVTGDEPRTEARFCVAVAEGPDKGMSLVVDGSRKSRAFVGQGEACDLTLTDRQVSRRHLALECQNGRLRVSDLGSTNGTSANGLGIVDVLLSGGESVRLGSTTLTVVRLDDIAEPPLVKARGFHRIIGASIEMRRLYPLFEKLAASDVPVLIEGETGTGKELLAETLHESGPRASRPFIVFDCGAVPAAHVAARLFGEMSSGMRGVFEQANGGTLFIDEIGELDVTLQPQLLRAIERGEVQRLGDDQATKVDVRILASTRHDLDRETHAKRFRDDLFYRLAVARVELPPLRRRRGDVRVLARHFWEELGGAPDAVPYGLFGQLDDYAWPGNVRELHGRILRHVTLGATAEQVTPEAPSSLTAALGSFVDVTLPYAQIRERVLRQLEQTYVEAAVAHYGTIQKAAAASGLALRYFQIMRARIARGPR